MKTRERGGQRRLLSLATAILLVPLGLLSRRVAWIPEEAGDALWAMMVFCLWRVILVRSRLGTVAIVALVHAYLVEVSQLTRWPWLVNFRSTFIGHMMLGQGFQWADMLAYTTGITLIYITFKKTEKQHPHT